MIPVLFHPITSPPLLMWHLAKTSHCQFLVGHDAIAADDGIAGNTRTAYWSELRDLKKFLCASQRRTYIEPEGVNPFKRL